MRTTKQRRRYNIDLPEEAIQVLRWHIDTQLHTPQQEDSDLLFPSIDGGFRSGSVLVKPFAEVANAIGLTKQITPRALRRTFNDLARAAQVQDLVTRSISGHLTEDMQRHYSTVSGAEQRQALAKVIDLTRARAERDAPCAGGEPLASGDHGGDHPLGGGDHSQRTG
jgi:integrase